MQRQAKMTNKLGRKIKHKEMTIQEEKKEMTGQDGSCVGRKTTTGGTGSCSSTWRTGGRRTKKG